MSILVWNKKTEWQARKNITKIQENCLWSKKKSLVNIKNIEISSGCALLYKNN